MVHHKNQSKNLPKLTPLIAASVVVISSILSPTTAHADQFDDQINQKKAQLQQSQGQANALGAQANDIQGQINELQTQIAGIQAQIDANTARQTELTNQIDAAQNRLEEQKGLLSANIRSMYIEGDISPLEMIASSKNLGDFVDKQEYRDRIKDSISGTMDEIERLKIQLDGQKKEVTAILDEQKSLRGALDQKNAEASAKLTSVNQDKAIFDASVAGLSKEISQLRTAQAQMYANLTGGSGHVPYSGSYGGFTWKNYTGEIFCGGGYPGVWCNATQDSLIDTWRLYNRECVSYAAWKMAANHRVSGFGGRGMAYEWPGTVARNGDGYTDSNPAPDTVMYIPPAMIGGVGHVAYVESVSGGWAHISQYNFAVNGRYSEMDVKIVPGIQFIHFTLSSS
ncbi:MAG TPA: CHAP domain-containing protein [Candidatus Saccharibacteria bacterium]|nr:CHAP domain-containing protein [Candidatus Saccharibacteria bacterium]